MLLFAQLLHLILQSVDDSIQAGHVSLVLLFHKYVDGGLDLGHCGGAAVLILRWWSGRNALVSRCLRLLLLVQSLLGSEESLG